MQRPELKIKRARGFLLIVAIVVLVVIALAIAALGNMTSADIRSSSGHAQSEQAYFVAASGIEHASLQFGNGTQCANLSNTNVAAGAGSFSTSGVLYVPARTTLNGAITAASTTINVASTAGYAPRGQVLIDDEYINYTSITATSLLNAQRGASGSTAAAHITGTPVAQTMCVVTSTGVVGGARRVLQKGIRLPGAMMVYAKANSVFTPFYRLWDGTAWGAEQAASSVGPNAINFMVLKFARTRNEAILGVQDSAGAITIQIWNGSSWSAATSLGSPAVTNYRGFDIDYERNSDRAVIVYSTSVNAQFSYRIWNGSTLSAATNITTATTPAMPVGFGTLRWIETAANPLAGSDELALIMTNSGGNNQGHVYGLRWTGSAWSDMGAGAADWDITAQNTATKIIDVAYESLSGNILFMWADNTTGNQFYRRYSGDPIGGNATLNIALMGGNPSWLKLAPDPTSNRIMYGAVDSASDFDTRVWTGSAWDAAHVELDGTIENTNDMVFDIAYETHPSNANVAWAVWGDGATVSRQRWNGATSTWAAVTTSGDDTAHVRLLAHPFKDSGAVFAQIYQSTTSATDDINAMQITAGGVAWPATETQIWAGPTVASPMRFRMNMDAERALIPVFSIEIYP